MKKILMWLGIVIVVLVIVAALAVHFFLDSAVKRGVETVGPKLTQVDVKLDGVSISVLSGSGKLKGLTLGNPKGYKTPQAILLGSATLHLKPTSIFSDKVVITKFEMIAPEITFEGGLKGNNLKDILANLDAATAGGAETNAPAGEPKAGKKLQVDDFLITGAKVHVSITGMTGREVTVPIPEIHLTGLGQNPEGITVAELTKRVLNEIEIAALKAAEDALSNIGKNINMDSLGKGSSNTVNKLGKGLNDLLKRK